MKALVEIAGWFVGIAAYTCTVVLGAGWWTGIVIF